MSPIAQRPRQPYELNPRKLRFSLWGASEPPSPHSSNTPPLPLSKGETLAKKNMAPLWALRAKMPANMPAKNWRPKMADQKCRQKHADMSPPQSPAQRVPIGRCARSWRACRSPAPVFPRGVSRLAAACRKLAGCRILRDVCLCSLFPATMSAGGSRMIPLVPTRGTGKPWLWIWGSSLPSRSIAFGVGHAFLYIFHSGIRNTYNIIWRFSSMGQLRPWRSIVSGGLYIIWCFSRGVIYNMAFLKGIIYNMAFLKGVIYNMAFLKYGAAPYPQGASYWASDYI